MCRRGIRPASTGPGTGTLTITCKGGKVIHHPARAAHRPGNRPGHSRTHWQVSVPGRRLAATGPARRRRIVRKVTRCAGSGRDRRASTRSGTPSTTASDAEVPCKRPDLPNGGRCALVYLPGLRPNPTSLVPSQLDSIFNIPAGKDNLCAVLHVATVTVAMITNSPLVARIGRAESDALSRDWIRPLWLSLCARALRVDLDRLGHRRDQREDPRGPGRQQARHLTLGVTVDGKRDVLGPWAGEHGDGEGSGCGSCRKSRTVAYGTCAGRSATGSRACLTR